MPSSFKSGGYGPLVALAFRLVRNRCTPRAWAMMNELKLRRKVRCHNGAVEISRRGLAIFGMMETGVDPQGFHMYNLNTYTKESLPCRE
jgi:hypothetical protein